MVSKPIGALSAVRGPEVTQERRDTHECVEGSLTAHFLKGITDFSVDENSRIVRVLVLPRQIM